MRLTPSQQQDIRKAVHEIFGPHALVRLFGSRLHQDARGGDVDLLVELSEPIAHPARLAAALSAKVSRAMDCRRVDVLVSAPGLRRLPIHDVAYREGVPL